MSRNIVMFLLILGTCWADILYFEPDNINDDKDVVDLRYRLPSGIMIPKDYSLHVKVNLSKLPFEGEVNITLIALITNDNVTLNSKDLTIRDLKFVDLNTTTALENDYVTDSKHEIMNITVKPHFEKDHHYSLRIKYNGILREDMTGFFRNWVHVPGSKRRIVRVGATHFQPTYARFAFPCWDEPMYKAKFNISVTHNNTLRAIANTEVLKTEEKDGMTTTTFKETPPMPTYLVAFAVSRHKFKEDKVDNFTYRVWAQEDRINDTDYALKVGRKILEEMNLYTNVSYQKYLPDKIDQFPARNFFPAAAMENWGLPIYRDSILLIQENSSTPLTKIGTLTTIAHEFVHQWFGNIVTPRWWKYVWLSEGFATYLHHLIGHKVAPDLRLNDTFVLEVMQESAMVLDAEPAARPLNKDANTIDDIYNAFNEIVYDKGGSIIRMISHAMTEEVFRKALNIYLTTYELSVADSDQFYGSLQKALNESGIKWKQPVDVVMHNWVEKPGYPVLTVKRVEHGYELTQERFKIALENITCSTKWWIPITYVEESKPDFTNTTPVDWFSPNDTSHTVSSTEKGWFVFNTQQAGYYRVNYDVENWELLIQELNKGNNTKIHLLNRAQMINDAFNLAYVAKLNYTVALNLTLYLTHEADYLPWQAAFTQLKFLRNMLRTSDKYYIFLRYVAYLMKTLTKDVGYEPKENDSDLVKVLRMNAMKFACEAGIKECTSYAEKTYQEWLKNPDMKLDINLKTEILCAGARIANETWNDTLKYLNSSTPNWGTKTDKITAQTCSNSSDILRNFLIASVASNFPLHYAIVAKNIVSRYPGGVPIVLNFLRERDERIQQLRGYELNVKSVCRSLGAAIMSEQHRLDLTDFLQDRKLTDSHELVMEKARPNVVWIGKFKSTIEEWLSANNDLFVNKTYINDTSTMAVASSM